MNNQTEGAPSADAGAANPIVQTDATATQAAASAAASAAPDPVAASVEAARDMIANGQGADDVAVWLARQCPERFADAAAAAKAIG